MNSKSKNFIKTNHPPASTFRRCTTPLRRSWQPTKDNPRMRLTKTLQFELNQYSERIKILQTENKRLRSLSSALNDYEDGSYASPLLVQHFQSELSSISDTINKRAVKLNNLETKVKSTRLTIGSDLPAQGEKARLLNENNHLIDFAFQQEQISAVELSKLRILHDLRDLCKYKRYVQYLTEGKSIDFNNEEEEIKNKKKQIENLKKAIEYEKFRILSIQAPQFEINEAATLIQKHWRGFYQRNNKDKYKNEVMTEEFESETEGTAEYNQDSSNDHPEEYSDNNDKCNDDNSIFEVTGVSNPEKEENFDFNNTPADAFDSHKNQDQDQTTVSYNKFPKKSPKRNNTARIEDLMEKSNFEESERNKIDKRKQILDKPLEERKKIKENNLNENQIATTNDQQNNQKGEPQNKCDQKLNKKDTITINSKNDTVRKLKLELLDQPSNNNNVQSPLNIKTYMSD